MIKKDADNNLWIGTWTGLNFLDPNTNEFKRLSRDYAVYPQKLIELIREKVKSNSAKEEIVKVGDYEDISKEFSIIKPRDFLVVSMGEGFIRDSSLFDYGWIEKQNGGLVWSSKDVTKSFHSGGDDKNRITVDVVKLVPGNYKLRYISDDSHSFGKWNSDAPADQNLWGISLFKIENNSEANLIKDYLLEPKNQVYINGNDIRSIYISEDGIVWIGTKNEGLNKFDFQKNRNKTYSFEENKKDWLSDNDVQFIYEDKSGILWLATNGGLNKFNPVNETFTVYTEEDGLPTNYISSILPGENNDL